VKSDLPVRDFKLAPKFGDLTFLRAATSVALDAAGLSSLAQQLGIGGALEQFNLDGMLALWRPAGPN
jgi:protease-4